MTHPLIPSLSSPVVRYGLLAGAVVILAGVAGFAALSGSKESIQRRTGPALEIAVVSPVEPEIQPGDTMEVGALSTGFDRAALDRAEQERAAIRADATLSPVDAWLDGVWSPDDAPRMPAPTPASHRLSPMEAYDAVVARGRRMAGRTEGPDGAWPRRSRDGADQERANQERAARWAARAEGTDTGDDRPGTGPVAYTDVIKYSSE
jgi:hypothetical protein